MNSLKRDKMVSRNYYVLQDIYEAIDARLQTIASKMDSLELEVTTTNLETQLEIANKLKLLDAIGTDLMSEEEQAEAYEAIKDELFAPSGSIQDPVVEEEGN